MSRLKRNIGHIGGIILWSTLFYMFWDEFVCICNQGNIWIPSLTRLLKLIFLNVPLFGHQLWYLFSYFYVLLIIWAVVKYNWWKWLFYAVPILLMPHIVLLLSGREVSIYLVRNFLFLGLPFFAIGAMLKSMGIGGADINSRNTIRSCWPGLLFCRWWPCLKGSAFCLWGNVPLGNSISAVSLLQYVCFLWLCLLRAIKNAGFRYGVRSIPCISTYFTPYLFIVAKLF